MRLTVVLFCPVLLALACAATLSFGEDATNAVVKELKGQLVSLSEKANMGVGIKTESGVVYTLVSNRMSSALFIDTNLLGKTLVMKGRASEKTKSFEVMGNLHSFRSGKVHKLYYYCNICSIEGIDPGPCMCCRETVHIVEE